MRWPLCWLHGHWPQKKGGFWDIAVNPYGITKVRVSRCRICRAMYEKIKRRTLRQFLSGVFKVRKFGQ